MVQKGYFIITDITGYTAYLSKSELDHAHEILKSLFDAQVMTIKPPLVISNFQGDAILSYVSEKKYGSRLARFRNTMMTTGIMLRLVFETALKIDQQLDVPAIPLPVSERIAGPGGQD